MTTRPAIEPKTSGRIGLFFPILVAVLGLVAWTGWWFVVANRLESGVDQAAVDLRQAGYQVGWSSRRVEGWPFRTLVRFRDVKLVAPSGHAIAAPRLDAEAQTYALGKWVAAAPDGIIVTRAEKGQLRITGQAVRASIAGLDRKPPRIVVELRKPVFTPLPGADPFPLASAELVDLYVRPSPATRGAGDLLFRVKGGAPRPDGMLEWIGGGEPFDLQVEGAATAVDRFRGTGWPQAARAWSAGGGRLVGVRGEARTGPTRASAAGSALTVAADGRLRGGVDLTLTGGPRSLLALGRTGAVDPLGARTAAAGMALGSGLDGAVRVRLDFTDEGAKLGPVRLSDSPRIY